MSDNNTVERAEQRVREMDRVTRQFSEQGNRYMQHMMNVRRTQNQQQSQQLQQVQQGQQPQRQSTVPAGGSAVHNNAPLNRRQGRGTNTRFEPVERAGSVPQTQTAEVHKNETERAVQQSSTQNTGTQNLQNCSTQNMHGHGLSKQGIDGEKLLLMALMYLLMTENADIKLILAIGYLIM